MMKTKNKLENKTLIVKTSTIPNAGMGLFAKKDFNEGDIIGYFKGDIYTDEELYKCDVTPDKYYFVGLDNGLNINCYRSNDLVKYCNDANGLTKGIYVNNGEIVVSRTHKSAYVKAITKIPAGSEIFIDYGEDYWDSVKNMNSL